LWWRVHEPEAPELKPDVALQNRFEQGLQVGRVARDHVPAGELIDLPFYQLDNKVAATAAALRRDAPAIYEATFFADETYAQIDILERRRPADGWCVIEVKASNSRKPEHLPDVAVQVHVARRSGLPIGRSEVMHLNRECRFPDLSNLFVREDVTALVEGALLGVPDELTAQLRMLHGPLPQVPIGEHCTSPHECPFLKRCWNLPEHHVGTLYRIPHKQVVDYEAQGYETIHDLPSDLELSVIHARQVKAVTTGRMVVEPGLAAALAEFTSPLAFLDFETVSLAIPVWNGCRPWETVPAQFSCHVEGPGGRLAHHASIAQGPEDPRPALAERLVAACRGARKVVAYYANFERDCIRQLATAVPHLAKELTAIEKKLVDLLPVVRNHIYHPDFGGSFGLKNVLPALVPGLSYDDLKIGEGQKASVELMRYMFQGERLPPDERAALRQSLLTYCERDTWAMVKMWERIRGLVAAQLELF
jgi:predicted RecB family nuclease